MHVQAAHKFIRYKPLVIFCPIPLGRKLILVMQFGSSCHLLLNCHNMLF